MSTDDGEDDEAHQARINEIIATLRLITSDLSVPDKRKVMRAGLDAYVFSGAQMEIYQTGLEVAVRALEGVSKEMDPDERKGNYPLGRLAGSNLREMVENTTLRLKLLKERMRN